MLQACRDTARPGVKECEVYARMMEAMMANGGEEPTLFLWAADKHPYPHPFRVPTTRRLEKGDMIICEMHPKFGGYFTHVERTFCLGKPEPRYLDIYDACLAAYRRGLDLFRPGRKISEAMDAVRDTIEGSGFGICEAGIHGHGLASLEYPRYRHHALRADEGALKAIGDEFRSGMVFAMNIDLFDPELAQRRDRLRVRRDDRDHRRQRTPHAFLLDRLPAAPCVTGASGLRRSRPRPARLQAAALHDRARQRVADDVLGKPRALDQRLEIDAGRDAHLVAHEDQVLGADVAGRAPRGRRTDNRPGRRPRHRSA